MRFILTLLLSFMLCLITASAYAASFALSPYIVDTQITAGQSADLVFMASGFTGVVEISVENMPVDITPKAVDVRDGAQIRLKLLCSPDVASGTHKGTIVFLAKSGNSVQSGIRIPCTLTVNGTTYNPAIPGFVPNAGGALSDASNKKTIYIIALSVAAILLIGGLIYYWKKSDA